MVCYTQYVAGRWSGDGGTDLPCHQITDRQRIGYNIPQAVAYSLMLMEMGKIVARNMSS